MVVDALRPCPNVSGYFLSGYSFLPHASDEFDSYVWTRKCLNPERKSCGSKNIWIRVDGL